MPYLRIPILGARYDPVRARGPIDGCDQFVMLLEGRLAFPSTDRIGSLVDGHLVAVFAYGHPRPIRIECVCR